MPHVYSAHKNSHFKNIVFRANAVCSVTHIRLNKLINNNTQAGRLLTHLQAGHSIHRLSALIDLGIFELSARVIDLQSHGFTVNKNRIEITNRFGEKARVTEYSLKVVA